MRNLRALPKGHLHLHMEAGMRRSTWEELLAARGKTVPVIEQYGDFSFFAESYMTLLEVMDTTDAFFRVIDEIIADAAADGAVYIELGVTPAFHVNKFGTEEAALEAMLDRVAQTGARLGVAVGLMPTIDRTGSLEDGVALATLAARYAGKGVVSLGLANDERGFPAEAWGEAYDIAKAAGLQSAPHAGELVGPESVRAAIDVLHADRILHGVKALEDPQLIARIVEEGICLDVCPTSNFLLGVVPALDAHPLPALLDAGVRCSINGDDPTLFGPGLLDEYEVVRSVIGLSDEQIAACAWSSIDCTLAPDDVKARAKADIDAWLASAP